MRHNEFGGMYEMVPSSNPDSECSVEDEVLRKLADETELAWEDFEKEDIEELHRDADEGRALSNALVVTQRFNQGRIGPLC